MRAGDTASCFLSHRPSGTSIQSISTQKKSEELVNPRVWEQYTDSCNANDARSYLPQSVDAYLPQSVDAYLATVLADQ